MTGFITTYCAAGISDKLTDLPRIILSMFVHAGSKGAAVVWISWDQASLMTEN